MVPRIGDWTLEERLSEDGRPVVVMFLGAGGPAPGPSREQFRRLADGRPEARFYEVDLAENPSLQAKYSLSGELMVLLFVDGEEVARHEGSSAVPQIQRVLGPSTPEADAQGP